jgi:integrase
VPLIGDKPLNEISTEEVQKVKTALIGWSPKTVNNVLTVLSVALKTAVEWGVIERVPCSIKLLRAPKSVAAFHDFSDFEKLVEAANGDGATAHLIVLLGGEAGLRCGEIMALEWRDIDFNNRQLSVARSEWKGHITTPKGGRVRHVPLTEQLTEALKAARHLRGPRVICDEKGQPLTQKIVQVTIRRVARRAGVKPGVHILRTHLLLTSGDEGSASKSDSRARWTSRPHDDAAVHACHTRCARGGDRVVEQTNRIRSHRSG